MGSEFSKRESGSGIEGQCGKLLTQNGKCGQPMDIEGRLTDRSAGEFLGRAFKGEA